MATHIDFKKEKEKRNSMTLNLAIQKYTESGGHFFDDGWMKYTKCKLVSGLYANRCFIVHESSLPGFEAEMTYNVYRFDETYNNVRPVNGEHFPYANTLNEAREIVKSIK